MTAVESSGRERLSFSDFLRPTVALMIGLLALVVTGAIITDQGPVGGVGNLFRQISYALLFVLTLMAVRVWDAPMKLAAPPLALLLAMGWCWLSLIWAIEPGIAFRRLLLTTLVVWSIFLTVQDIGYRKTLIVLSVFLCLMLALNYIYVFAFPQIGVHQAGESMDKNLIGDWRGILPQKNITGAMCAFTILIMMFSERSLPLVIRAIVIAGATFMLVKTSSKTSLGILFLAIASGGLYWRLSPRHRVFVIPVLVVVGLVAMMMVIDQWDTLYGPFRRKDALTGRVQIWPYMFSYIRDHWVFGAGFGSFWNIGDESPIFDYSNDWVRQISSGHNGYIDLIAQVGAPGTVLAVFAVFLIPLAHLLNNKRISPRRGALVVAILIFCAGHNLTESSLLDRDAVVQVFAMFGVALAGVAARIPSSSEGSRRRQASRG